MTSTIKYLPSVIEKGSYESWSWRKWSDGTSECWLDLNESTARAFEPAGSVFYRTIAGLSFPNGLFVTLPIVIPSVYFANVGGCVVGAVSTTNCSITILSASSTARTVHLYLYAKGKWR